MQAVRGDRRDGCRRQRTEQHRPAHSPKPPQFHIDNTHDEAQRCHIRPKFDEQPRPDGGALADSGGSARSAQRKREQRQGIRGQRFNCKGDNGRIIPACAGHALCELRGIDALGAFDQRVRSRRRLRVRDSNTHAVARKRADAFMQRRRGRCVDAQGAGPIHDGCIVSRVKQTFPARVVSIGKNAAHVVLDTEEQPRVADLKRAAGKREMLTPGDRVHVRLLEDGRTLVESVEPRTFTLQRRTAEGRAKTMAANVDAIVTVTALAEPPPRLLTLDQLLAFAELENIDALVVLTKPDLAGDATTNRLLSLYRSLGYETLVVNPKAGENVEDLRTAISHRHALLCGVSGVGKSSIFRALGGDAVVGDVSRHGIGRQTTSSSRLYRMPHGFLIDSPGVAEFGLGAVTPQDLIEGFREMRDLPGRCRFTDCSHLHEPDCALQAAVAQGAVSRSRYESYRRILGLS